MSNRKRKQATRDTGPFKGEFSFVNKDASNIDSKDHNAAVSWHVMNRYEKWKKQEHSKKTLDSSNTSQQPIGDSSDVQGQSKSSDTSANSYPPEPWQVEAAEQSMLGGAGPGVLPGIGHLSDTVTMPLPEPVLQASATSSSSVTLDGAGLEAGISSQSDVPPLISRILAFAYGTVVPTMWPNDAAKPKWTYEISRTWDDIAAINEDSCYASATLCFYATLMASAINDRDVALQACFFQTSAMAELGTRINSSGRPHSSATMRAMLRLFSAETIIDNTSTARTHLKMLRKVVSAEGGVILLDSWFRENLLAADCYFALKYETRPVFPANEWTPGPLNQPWRNRLAVAGVKSEHSASVHSSIEHANLRSVITDFRELFKVESYTTLHDVSVDDQFLRWRQLRKFDCVNRLADHQLGVKLFPHLYLRPKLQLAVCTAIALMVAMVLGSPEPVRFGMKLITDLRSRIVEARQELEAEILNDSDEEPPQEVLLWLSYVDHLAGCTHPVLSSASRSYSEVERSSEPLHEVYGREQEDLAKLFLYSSALVVEIKGRRRSRDREAVKGLYESCGTSWRQPLESVTSSEIGDTPSGS